MQVLILHGWGHNKAVWQEVANMLGKVALVPDMPGFGSEPVPQNDWGVPEYANWVTKRVKKEKKVIIIGHSFGGRVAAEIASKKPPWLAGLILSGSPNIYRPSSGTRLKIGLYKTLRPLMPMRLKKFFYSGNLKSARGLEKVFRKVVNYDQTNKLKKINVPTLIVWGEEDREVPLKIGREIHQLVHCSKLEILPKTGHNPQIDSPNLFFGKINEFIKTLK